MSLSRSLICLSSLAVLACFSGCTHNHYYGNVPMQMASDPCATPVMGPVVGARSAASKPVVLSSAPVVNDNYCEIPAGNEPVILSSRPATSSASAARSSAPPRVVVSDPNYGSRQSGWRKRSGSSTASTRISGAIDDEELAR